MPNLSRNYARLDEVSLELQRMHNELGCWSKRRAQADHVGQHRAQLGAITTLINGVLARLNSDLVAIDLCRSVGAVYDDCRAAEQRLLWLRRVWSFYRTKLDQRDDPNLAQTLRAADEVIWSCHQQIFRSAEAIGLPVQPGPTPLAYIDDHPQPRAIPTNDRQQIRALKDMAAVDLIQDYLARLPIALIALPVTSISAPWQLATLAHEVGHHIQHTFLADGALVTRFCEQLTAETGFGQDSPPWGSWSEEVFADLFSVLMVGPPAAQAILALELKSLPQMLERRIRYPAAAVRLALMDYTAALLDTGKPPPAQATAALARRGLAIDGATVEAAAADQDAADIPAIVDVALNRLIDGTSLTWLCGFQPDPFRSGGAVEQWSAALRAADPPPVLCTLREARLLVGAAQVAWDQIAGDAGLDPAQRSAQRTRLATTAQASIAASREPGARSGAQNGPSLTGAADELANLLLGLTPQQLGV